MSRDHEPAASRARPSGETGRILQFRRRVLVPRAADRPIADPLRHFEEEEERRRMQQNLAAAVVIVVIIISGLWLIDHLRTSARIADCVAAGYRNCVPLDVDRVPDR